MGARDLTRLRPGRGIKMLRIELKREEDPQGAAQRMKDVRCADGDLGKFIYTESRTPQLSSQTSGKQFREKQR